mmetsp:Transcript_12947/g.45941  ORF Transcript_12947/g.45941 Transcript_12947/m.45941 type:complete len:279 (+) Transcript_12947:2442-3278(+)
MRPRRPGRQPARRPHLRPLRLRHQASDTARQRFGRDSRHSRWAEAFSRTTTMPCPPWSRAAYRAPPRRAASAAAAVRHGLGRPRPSQRGWPSRRGRRQQSPRGQELDSRKNRRPLGSSREQPRWHRACRFATMSPAPPRRRGREPSKSNRCHAEFPRLQASTAEPKASLPPLPPPRLPQFPHAGLAWTSSPQTQAPVRCTQRRPLRCLLWNHEVPPFDGRLGDYRRLLGFSAGGCLPSNPAPAPPPALPLARPVPTPHGLARKRRRPLSAPWRGVPRA